ncbi:hypothetical protein ACS0TY_001125 [Phlomoides rotata]
MEQSSTISLDRVSLWIRAADIPIAFQTERVIKSIAARFGILECFKTPEKLVPNKFLRFKVSIDHTKPLLRGLFVRFGGEPIWIAVTYESLLVFCFCCGVIGHQFHNCKEYDHDYPIEVASMKFGASLRAQSGCKGTPGTVVYTDGYAD